jgi:hypothetical protein
MPKGQFSYILFGLDAYSQYVYAVPLKDKTASSVLQGFLQIFSTVGWYEALYLDNETSFQKVAGLLVKMAPIAIHYSTPYCHFQNNAENYIKSFKRNFLKILNDSENPHENQDWALLLPTVTQSLNRQIIQSIGISRDTVHFNCPTQFYPLAQIADEDNPELQQQLDSTDINIYDAMKSVREKYTANSRKASVPKMTPGQLVFVIDKTPSPPGVSSILKAPTKGPFRLHKLEDRNATLIDIETGKIFHSHVEFLRPISVKQYKTLLTKNWDFNTHFSKAPVSRITRSTFDTVAHPITRTDVLSSEQDSDLAKLFEQPPNPPTGTARDGPMGEPPDGHHATHDLNPDDGAEFNSFRVHDDLSQKYRQSLMDYSRRHSPAQSVQFAEKAFYDHFYA